MMSVSASSLLATLELSYKVKILTTVLEMFVLPDNVFLNIQIK